MCMKQRLRRYHADRVVGFFHFAPNLQQFRADGFQMLGNYILDGNIPFGNSRGKHKRTGFNLIRNNSVFRPVQPGYALDTDHIRTGALDIGSHAV